MLHSDLITSLALQHTGAVSGAHGGTHATTALALQTCAYYMLVHTEPRYTFKQHHESANSGVIFQTTVASNSGSSSSATTMSNS
eukprot:12239-Heterococcus_DN1.PRE.2